MTAYSHSQAPHKKALYWEIAFYIVTFCAILTFVLLQAFGDGPDEINRFKVAQYICKHLALPHGADPEVFIAGYGASYAYQPILPYIIQGLAMRFICYFTQDPLVLLVTSRLVNAVFGVLMAFYVRKIAKLVFKDHLTGWLFTLFIVFLPQNLFLHSYVNTDSMAALSASMIIYAMLRGYQDRFSIKTSILLAAGISFCALSYYNAYGIILCSIIFFLFCFIKREGGSTNIQWQPLLQKGFFITVLVLLGISWWFIHNYNLYDGDFLGMTARQEDAVRTALPDYNPLTKSTPYTEGLTVWEMIFDGSFLRLVTNSFIATFGPMLIPTHRPIYVVYRFTFLFSLLGFLIPFQKRKYAEFIKDRDVYLFNGLMMAATAIPVILCIYYSYTWDYQPQGRYILPALIPFMYLITVGFDKLMTLLDRLVFFIPNFSGIMKRLMILFVIGAMAVTITTVFVPYYLGHTNLYDMGK